MVAAAATGQRPHRPAQAEVPDPAPATVPPATATATATRRRRLTIAAIAAGALVVVIAALVIWAPWVKPPVLRPAGVTADAATISSVSFRWASPPTGPLPDHYSIVRDGTVIGSVPGTVTFYRAARLAPGTPYRFQVVAVSVDQQGLPIAKKFYAETGIKALPLYIDRSAKAAFTLRLDSQRHLKLRLACAVGGRSAQQIVTDALDQLLAAMPELDTLATKAKRRG